MSVPLGSLEARTGSVIGGLAVTAARPVPGDVLRAMAGPISAGARPLLAAEQPVGLFATGTADLERGDPIWAAADTDLLNLDELRALAGVAGDAGSVLCRLYEMEGASFLRRLRGAFALALWDRRNQRLLLAVDHFGMRRLYYARRAGETVFASRIACLLRGRESTGVDPAAIYSYLNLGFLPAPDTPFAGVRRLPPGHAMYVSGGHHKVEPFWDVRYSEETHREGRAAADIYRLSHQAVREAWGGSKPKEVGAFLSGGTDSSTILGLMTRVTGEPVTCFSIGFREERYDELRYARLSAEHFGSSLHTRIVTPDDAFEALPGLVDAYDEPLGNNSAIGTLFCSRMAREHGVTRLLAGDGGDEIFGGNERYRTDQIFARYGRLPAAIRKGLVEPVLSWLPSPAPGILGRAQRYVRRANIPNPARFYSYEFHVAQNAATLLEPEFLRQVGSAGPQQTLEEHFRRAHATSELNRLLYLDLKLTIGDNDLFKVTRTADMAGVGVRFPFLDVPLVEFTSTLPTRFKVRGLEKRVLFKRAFRALLPAETLAKRKHGFGVPTADWLRTHPGIREMARDTLLDSRTAQRGYFRRGALDRLFEQHAADSSAFYGDIIWTLLMLELWHRRHADRAEHAR